jgi:hypothetical protein
MENATFPDNKVTNFILEKPAQVWFPESVPTGLYGRQPGFYSQVLEFGSLTLFDDIFRIIF